MHSDQEIITLYKEEQSREQAFVLLLEKYQRPIYYYIRRMVLDHDSADDLAQNTFINVWRSLGQFRGDSKLSTWIYTIAHNQCINFLKQQKRMNKVALEDYEQVISKNLQEDEHYSGDEIQLKLQLALATLPEKQKAVFVMKYYEEKKYEEISTITGTSVGALKASFHHAVQKIETFLKNQHTGH